MIYKTGTGKFFGRFRNSIILSPNKITIKKRKRLNKKLKISARLNTFTESLSFFGRTIASSNLNEEITVTILIRLK
jgi:hypothetical protein